MYLKIGDIEKITKLCKKKKIYKKIRVLNSKYNVIIYYKNNCKIIWLETVQFSNYLKPLKYIMYI